MERYQLTDAYDISRLIKGGWHLAGGHGAIEERQAIADMATFVEAGIDTFDCADIYTGVEEMIGRFRQQYPMLAARVRVHTKFVPDLAHLGQINAQYVERIVDRSLIRLGVEQLDLVQFHWWDFEKDGYVEAALELENLRKAGKISRVGVTNFDTDHLAELCDAGVTVSAHQLQYSVLDNRPSDRMVDFCESRGIALLCYGTVAGGFLSDRWLGQPEPIGALANRSLVKYKLIIDEFGNWQRFQGLLQLLRRIADAHGVDIASVATKAILQRRGVAAAIVGATSTRHLGAHQQLSVFELNDIESNEIEQMTKASSGPAGDVYQLERDRHGPHGRIMKYDLNEKPATR